MERRRLTTKWAKSVPAPTDKDQEFHFDEEVPQFGLRVLSSGTRTWIINLTKDGKLYRRKLAPLARCTAEQARDMAKVAIGQIISGSGEYVQGREQKRAEREAADLAARQVAAARQDAQEQTLRKLCALYVNDLQRRQRSSWREVENAFKLHVYNTPQAAMPARELELPDIGAILRPLVKARKERSAGKLRSHLHAAYKLAASAAGKMKVDPELLALGVKTNPVAFAEAMASKPRDRKALTVDELRAIFSGLSKDASLPARVAWLNILLGGQRPQQLVRAEVGDFDGAALTLYDGKGKRKEPRAHVVPVIGEAFPILKNLAEVGRKRGSPWLFANGNGNVHMWPSTLNVPVKAISEKLGGAPFNQEDLRSAAETQLIKLDVSEGIRAQLLSHGLGGLQNRHYAKGDFLDEKTAALKKWHRRIGEIMAEKVVA